MGLADGTKFRLDPDTGRSLLHANSIRFYTTHPCTNRGRRLPRRPLQFLVGQPSQARCHYFSTECVRRWTLVKYGIRFGSILRICGHRKFGRLKVLSHSDLVFSPPSRVNLRDLFAIAVRFAEKRNVATESNHDVGKCWWSAWFANQLPILGYPFCSTVRLICFR